MISEKLAFSFLVIASVGSFGQSQGEKSESGALTLYTNAGWTFGYPAVRAFVSVPGLGSAISPEKKTLPAPSFGIAVKAWKFLAPFADFTLIDTGKAYAQVGPVRADGQASTFTFHGGLRLVGGTSRLRPYAQFGGGMVHERAKLTFTTGPLSTSDAASNSMGSILYGGGIQLFAGGKWGSDIGFDGFRLPKPLNGASQNYSRFRVGIFYQTKSVVH
jgi:hypothetical protein